MLALLLCTTLLLDPTVPSTPTGPSALAPTQDDAPTESSQAEDPHRQFDFWVGEWSVQNRNIDESGVWQDGDVTRARITPVIGGQAILEEWAGPLHGSFMNGFSLRAYDPQQSRWSLLLLWTTTGDGSFGQLHGRFRHGRGEFFAPESGPRQTRYSFSDGLPDSVRWDSSTTQDSGLSWKTDWIMEFSRTRAAQEVTQDALFERDWTSGTLSQHAEARKLDWLLGTWRGTQTDISGNTSEARLRSRLLNKDAMVLDVLETRTAPDEQWQGRLFVRAWLASGQTWEGWTVRAEDTRLLRNKGTLGEGGALFEEVGALEAERSSETIRHIDETHLVIEEAVGTGRSRRVLRTTELERVNSPR